MFLTLVKTVWILLLIISKEKYICTGEPECVTPFTNRGTNCTCPNVTTSCQNPLTNNGSYKSYVKCYTSGQSCDGENNCGDWSDERNCTCRSSDVPCACLSAACNCSQARNNRNEICIAPSAILDGKPDCHDMSDEPCSVAFLFFLKIESIYDYRCLSEEKKHQAATGLKYATGFICPDLKCSYLDGKPSNHCAALTSFSIGPTSCVKSTSKIIQCETDEFTLYSSLCNGVPDCPDGSDELLDVPGFKCSSKDSLGLIDPSCVLPQPNLYDNDTYCADSSDVCYKEGKFHCFRCLDGKLVVSKKQVCNGVVDCYDLSDECLCHNQTTCNNIMGASFESCSYGSMLCNGTCTDMELILCNKSHNCINNVNMKHCLSNDKFVSQVEKITCLAGGTGGIIGLPYRATVCDGNQECSDYIDELNCTTRHYCIAGTSISIPMDKVCDGHLDCNDGSDESRALCVSRHYCVSGDPLSVAPEMIEDGFEDCSDGSDECPRNSNRTMVFSSQYEMINNPVLRVLFWIMGLVAFGGNLFVIVTTVIDMQKPGSIVPIKQSCNWFILNLSIFDFIFSVYLLIIAIKGAQFSGKYCFYDLQWRTSSLCSFLGTLMMISTQGSAFMMTVITTFRLLFVFMPFKSNTIDFKWSIGSTTVVWLIAIVLSIVPSLSRFSDYFSTSVWFPNYFYRELTLKKVDLFNMAQRINRSIPFVGNWQDAKNKVEDTFQSLSIRGEFGYYSENSVCMPDLFSKKGFNAWQFSCFIITFNFLLFLYVVASYVIIYRRSTQMKAKNGGSNFILQARITRLILTDFACWIPICILAYLSFAGVQLQPIVYVISAGVLLPINSALNPIIYSSAISDLASKVIARVRGRVQSPRRNSTLSSKTIHESRFTEYDISRRRESRFKTRDFSRN